jgi:hypothetical protein
VKISRGFLRAFLGLYAISLVAGILSFPWPPPLQGVLFAVVLNALIVAAGLFFGRKHGLGAPYLEGEGERPPLRRIFFAAIVGAVIAAAIVAVLPLAGLEKRMIDDGALPLWQRFVMSYTGGVLEEIIFRLLVVSAVVWLLRLVRSVPRTFAVSVAIVVSAVLFAAAHLPRWLATGGDARTIAAVMAVNGLGAMVFALIYVRWGIEPAIVGHVAADIGVHVIGPYFFV